MNLVLVQDIPDVSLVTEVDLTDPMPTYKICKQMEKVCIKNDGIGLSAVQIGLPLKLFIVKIDDHFDYFVNCTYEKASAGFQRVVEGCLSLPNRFFTVKRQYAVKVVGKRLTHQNQFIDFSETYSGMMAAVFSHEIDHQDGILISSIGTEVVMQRK